MISSDGLKVSRVSMYIDRKTGYYDRCRIDKWSTIVSSGW